MTSVSEFWKLNFESKCLLHILGVRHEMNQHYRRICVNTPFFHVYGVVICIMNAMNHGSTLVVPAPHFNPEESLKTISKEKCDVIYGTPTSAHL